MTDVNLRGTAVTDQPNLLIRVKLAVLTQNTVSFVAAWSSKIPRSNCESLQKCFVPLNFAATNHKVNCCVSRGRGLHLDGGIDNVRLAVFVNV